MVSFEANVSGGQIGDALAEDMEELVEALVVLGKRLYDSDEDLADLEEYLSHQTHDDRVRLKQFAEKIAGMVG